MPTYKKKIVTWRDSNQKECVRCHKTGYLEHYTREGETTVFRQMVHPKKGQGGNSRKCDVGEYVTEEQFFEEIDSNQQVPQQLQTKLHGSEKKYTKRVPESSQVQVITAWRHICQRCEHYWKSDIKWPKTCPDCKSVNWCME